MRKLALLPLLLTGCATVSQHPQQKQQSFEQRYETRMKKVQSCISSSIVAVLSIPAKGFDEMNHICDEED